MARPRKDGKRAPGIQGKSGFLYIVISQNVLKDGVKKSEKKWIATKLPDTPENVKKASEARMKLINRKAPAPIDRNISVSAYTELVLSKRNVKYPIQLILHIIIGAIRSRNTSETQR